MASSPEELRKAAHNTRRLALQAEDPEQRAKLFAMAADIDRQALEAEQTLAGGDRAQLPGVRPDEPRAVPRKRPWLRRRRKST